MKRRGKKKSLDREESFLYAPKSKSRKPNPTQYPSSNTQIRGFKIDELVKSQKVRCPVIPAKAGIQLSPLTLPLSPGDGGEGGGEGEE
jgi:hypothetical protein